MNENNRKYPLRKSYQIAFLKHVIKSLEQNGNEEIFDAFYENLTELLECDEEDEFSYKHFLVPDGSFITVKESNSFIRDGTTGLKLWPAAIKLSEFIISQKEYFKHKSILELGSGASGYVGLTLLKVTKAKKIFLSDCHETVIKNLIENANLNLDQPSEVLEPSILIRHRVKLKDREFAISSLPWEEIDEHKNELNSILSPNVILAADVIYDDTIFEPLIHCLNTLFNNDNGNTLEFILSQTIRNEDTFHKFCELLKKNSFSATEMLFDNNNELFPRETHSKEEIRVLKIMRL